MTNTNNHRAERIAQYITRELTTLLQRRVKDPRCAGTQIMHVRLTPDKSLAKIYVLFADESLDTVKAGLAGLKKAKGFLRSELAKQMSMRQVPDLRFLFDESVPYGRQLSSLIDTAIKLDEKPQET